MTVLPDAENRIIVSSFYGQNIGTWRTDRQTDRQTELLWLLQRSAPRAMRTRYKNRCMKC